MAKWFEDFSGYALDTALQSYNWTQHWSTSPSAIVRDSGEERYVELVSTSTVHHASWSYDPVGELDANDYPIRIRTQFEFSTSTGTFAAIHISGSGTSRNAYHGMGFTFQDRLQMRREQDSSSLNLGPPISDFFNANTRYESLFEVHSGGVRVKVWEAGASEPGGWTRAESNTDLTSGRVGFGVSSESGFLRLYRFGVGTNGEDAPVEHGISTATITADLTLDAAATATKAATEAALDTGIVLDAAATAGVVEPQATITADLVLDTVATAHSPATGFSWVAPPEGGQVEDTVQLVTQVRDPRVAAVRYRVGDTIIGIAEPEGQ